MNASRAREIASIGVVVVLAVSGDCAAQSAPANGARASAKEPWQWTPAERAAARRDPAKRSERLHAYNARRNPNFPPPADVIEGKKNPELFFVTELFEMLVRSSFVLLPIDYPHVVRQRSSDLFQHHGEWEQFAAIVTEYAAVLKEERDAGNALDQERVTELQDVKCAASARALRAARQAFGRERFDRMLYEVVRPTRTYTPDTDFDKSIGSALRREERCQ